MEFERNRRRVRTVAMISLIDIMFFILIFFMFSTSFLHNHSMELRVPSKNTTARDPQTLAVRVTGEGAILIGDKPYDLTGFDEEMRKRLLIEPTQKIQLLSDATASVQQLVNALDVIYRRGGQNVSVAKWLALPEVPSGV